MNADTPFRAIVVDDVAIIREGRARELEKVGITVCGVYDFDQARHAVTAGTVTRAHLDGVVLDAHDNTPRGVPENSALGGIDLLKRIRGQGGAEALTYQQARAQRRPGAQLTIMMVTQIYDDVPTLGHRFQENGGDLLWPSDWDTDHAEMALALRDPERFSRQQLDHQRRSMPKLRQLGLADAAATHQLEAAAQELEARGIPALARRYSVGDPSVRDSLNHHVRKWASTYSITPPPAKQVYSWLRTTLLGQESAAPGSRLGNRFIPIRARDGRGGSRPQQPDRHNPHKDDPDPSSDPEHP